MRDLPEIDAPASDCPCCGDSLHRDGTWRVRCRRCGFLRSNLSPGAGAPVGGLEALRRANFRRLLDVVEGFRPLSGCRVLEVGCDQGLFLEECARRGARPEAIEPDPDAADAARRQGHSVVVGYFPDDLPDSGQFDLIAFNDVFEHLPDPVQSLHRCYELLAPAGLLILNLPSSHGILYRTATLTAKLGWVAPLQRLWQVGLSSPHITYFSPGNLRAFVGRHTSLVVLDQGRLSTLSRRGLRSRLSATMDGPALSVMHALLSATAGIIERMPADIQYLIARKPS